MKTFIQRHRLDLIGVGLAVLIASGLLIFFNTKIKPDRYQRHCVGNLKQIGLAVMQYSRDYDEKFPLTNNWVDGLYPYSKKPPIFVCLIRPDLPHGYALHRGTQWMYGLSSLDNPVETVLVFESDAGTRNPSDFGTSLPKPARHPNSHATLFFDGHVKVLAQPDLKFGYDPKVLFAKKRKSEMQDAQRRRELEKEEAQRRWLIEQNQKRKSKPSSTQ
jgi:prepilin-type processing-associated H-X9-DG protein